jgi:hypothetical protein
MRALLLATLLVLAGCLGGPVGTTPEETETPTATPTPSPTATAVCEPYEPAKVNPSREDVTPSPLPGKPEELTADSAKAFATAYEEAYARNGELQPDTKRVETYTGDVSVEAVDGGYVVRMFAVTNVWHGGVQQGTHTSTVIHGDGAQIPVAYYVTDRLVRRDSGGYDEEPTPRDGTILECW